MKIGIIGAGNWGRRHAKEYYKLNHQVVVFDLLQENLDWCRKECSAETVTDYKKILQDNSIKHISICTPNPTHYTLGLEALHAGKNVLIEKPLAENSGDALELFRLASKKNLILMAGHVFRFNNAIRKVKDVINSEDLGKIFQIRCDWHQNIHPTDYRDIVLDIGLHPLDVIHYLFNKSPSQINCSRRSFNKRYADMAILNFDLESVDSNIFVTIDLCWTTPLKSRAVTIIGSKKTIQVQSLNQKILLIDNDTEETQVVNIHVNDPLSDELNFFITCNYQEFMQNDNSPNGKVAAEVIKMIEMTNPFEII